MTSIQSVLAAIAIILIDLLGRAGLDKVLAITGGPTMVGLWAQLQSVLDVVSGVATTGIAQGMTVLVAQVREEQDERNLLQSALKIGLAISLAMAILLTMVAPALAAWLTQSRIEASLFVLAAWTGCLTVIPATLSAYWLGKHQQQRMLALALLIGMVWVLVGVGAWFKLSLRGLVLLQCGVLVIFGSVIWHYIRQLAQVGDDLAQGQEYFRKLLKFIPVSLSIGIMSPASMLMIRGQLSATLSWNDVGFLQALWRSSDWVTAAAAGVLSLVFLPRLSSTFGSSRFKNELIRSGVVVLIPAACLLMLIYFNQRFILATLYDARFTISDKTAALFMLGSWMRIASWVFLFGLFAAHRTSMIAAGELLSLPLLAFLLWIFSAGMTLERAALLYLVSFIVYLGFNAIVLLTSLIARRKT